MPIQHPYSHQPVMVHMFKKVIVGGLGAYHEIFKNTMIKPEKYSKPVQEIHRLFTLLIERENNSGKKRDWEIIRDTLCPILEFDTAYRYRLQDIMKEANLKKLGPDKDFKKHVSGMPDYNFNLK